MQLCLVETLYISTKANFGSIFLYTGIFGYRYIDIIVDAICMNIVGEHMRIDLNSTHTRLVIQQQNMRLLCTVEETLQLLSEIASLLPTMQKKQEELQEQLVDIVALDQKLREQYLLANAHPHKNIEQYVVQLSKIPYEQYVSGMEILLFVWRLDEFGQYVVDTGVAEYCQRASVSLDPLLENIVAAIAVGLDMDAEHAMHQLWDRGSFDSALHRYCRFHMATTPALTQALLRLSQPMQWMPEGHFYMGSDSTEAWDFEQPVHSVQLSKGLWISKFPVTQQFYQYVMGKNTVHISSAQGAMLPIVHVSWFDAIEFCNRLSLLTGKEPAYTISAPEKPEDTQKKGRKKKSTVRSTDRVVHWNRSSTGYRLLTEAEWECAAKGWQAYEYAGSDMCRDVAWTLENSTEQLQPVGTKAANSLDIHDMSGNVWEWCWDVYQSEYYAHSPSVDPIGPAPTETESQRVCRGGSFLAEDSNARVSLRGRFEATTTWRALGFRIGCADG